MSLVMLRGFKPSFNHAAVASLPLFD